MLKMLEIEFCFIDFVDCRKSKDVIGNPKGQGQEKDVLISREKKNKNKSSVGNHNRRAGAQWKRSRGMFPA